MLLPLQGVLASPTHKTMASLRYAMGCGLFCPLPFLLVGDLWLRALFHHLLGMFAAVGKVFNHDEYTFWGIGFADVPS